MKAAELFSIIHNFDIREPLRRFQPKHVIVAINQVGEIAGAERFKHHPTWDEQDAFFSKHKGCVFF